VIFNRNIFILASGIFFVLAAAAGCKQNSKQEIIATSPYDFKHPLKLVLDDALIEISGIAFYPKDTSVFAISDETGYLYKLHFQNKFIVQKWKFDKAHDFEDVVFLDSTFYVMESSGNIHTINFAKTGDTIYTRKNNFPAKGKSKNEFESMYYDDMRKALILLCKDCEEDKKGSVTAWSYNPLSGAFTDNAYKINVDAIAAKTGEAKMKFKPSAATINPLTGDVWIVSAVNGLLVITGRDGVVKKVYKLNRGLFTQPEGITFTPWGDLLISNEAGDKYNVPTLFIFKPIKKN
jgi:uncharacterized protein YjiK